MHKLKLENEGLSLSYDPKVHAAYIKVREGQVAKTIEEANGKVMVDLDSHGRLLGIEVLDPQQIEIRTVTRIAKEFKTPALRQINPKAIPELYACA